MLSLQQLGSLLWRSLDPQAENIRMLFVQPKKKKQQNTKKPKLIERVGLGILLMSQDFFKYYPRSKMMPIGSSRHGAVVNESD